MPRCKFVLVFKEVNTLDHFFYREKSAPCQDEDAQKECIRETLEELRKEFPNLELIYSHILPMENEYETNEQLWNWSKGILNAGYDNIVLCAKDWIIGENEDNPNKSTFEEWFEGEGYYDFEHTPPKRIILKGGNDFAFRGLYARSKVKSNSNQ